MMDTLELHEALMLHAALLEAYGGRPGIRDRGLLESALAAPLATFDGQPLYPSLWDRVAALGRSLIGNHPFVDGNKRVGLAAMSIVLLRNGYELACDHNESERLILGVASGSIEREEIAAWLESHSRKRA